MNNNDTLDGLRAVLKLTDKDVAECFAFGGHTLSPGAQPGLASQAPGEEPTMLTDALLCAFLDGLIIARRGPLPSGAAPPELDTPLTNNMILKKLRIALNLYEEGMLKLFHAGGKTLSKREMTALFRKPAHKYYRDCNDNLLSVFLEGVKKSATLPTA